MITPGLPALSAAVPLVGWVFTVNVNVSLSGSESLAATFTSTALSSSVVSASSPATGARLTALVVADTEAALRTTWLSPAPSRRSSSKS